MSVRPWSARDPESMYRRVVETDSGNENFIQKVLWADEDTQLCLMDVPNNGRPELMQLTHSFKILDIRDGSEGKPLVETLADDPGSLFNRVIIMGGGSSLLHNLAEARVTSSDFLISCNHHGGKITNADAIVFCDRATARIDSVQKSTAFKITYWGDLTDYVLPLSERDQWFYNSTPYLALWLADLMGLPTLLAGFDLYQDAEYAEGGEALSSQDLDTHLRNWGLAKSYLKNPDLFKTFKTSPLWEHFGAFE